MIRVSFGWPFFIDSVKDTVPELIKHNFYDRSQQSTNRDIQWVGVPNKREKKALSNCPSPSLPPPRKKPTWFVLRVIKVNVEGMATITDDFGRARVILDAKRWEGRVELRFLGFNLNRGLLVPVSDGEELVPVNRTWVECTGPKRRTKQGVSFNESCSSATHCAWAWRENGD